MLEDEVIAEGHGDGKRGLYEEGADNPSAIIILLTAALFSLGEI